MFVTTFAIYDIETGNCEYREGFLHSGVIALLKGPTAEQKELAAQQSAFFQTLQSSFATMFAGQTNILKALNTAMQPILQAGPGQFGLTKPEETALRTGASETTATQFASSAKALREQLAARGGGNAFLPSGAEAQLESGLYQSAAEEEARAQQDITKWGYDVVGRQNYWQAAGALGGVAGLMSPTGYAAGATGAGSAAGTTWADIAKEQQTGSPWATIGGLFAGGSTTALGAKAMGNLPMPTPSPAPPTGGLPPLPSAGDLPPLP